MTEGPPETTAATATLTAFDIGCVVVGGIIGVGIFFTPSLVAQEVDDAHQVILAWGLGGVIAILGALVFAELSVRVPGHGGTFVYIQAALGDLPAFLYGWANWLVIQSGALGVIGLIMVDYADRLLFGVPRTQDGVKVAITCLAIALFTFLNVIGLHVGKRVQNGLTVVKTLAVFGLVVLALFAEGGSGTPAPPAPEVAAPKGIVLALCGAMLPVLFAFGGWQQGSFVAGAARRPLRDVPLGIVGGVLVVVLAYLTVNLSFIDLLGFEGAARSDAIGADAARVALEPFGWGEHASRVLAAMVVVSALGIMNTICLAPPYVLHAMARRRLFFRGAAELHATFGTPVLAVCVQGAWGILLLVTVYWLYGRATLGLLVDGVVFVDWLFFGLCGLSLLLLRRRAGGRGFRAPGGSAVALAFTLLALAVTVGAIAQSSEASLTGMTLCLCGLPFFLLVRRASAGSR